MFALALVKRMCSGDLNKFLALSSITLESLAVELEKFEDQGKNIEFSAKDGVLTVSANQNKIVINRQIPNQQIWYSSLLSGPQRFNYVGDKWINSKGTNIESVLMEDLKKSW